MLAVIIFFAGLATIAVVAALKYRRRAETAELGERDARGSNDVLRTKLEAAERERDQALEAAERRHSVVLDSERRAHEAYVAELQKATEEKVELVRGSRKELADEMKAVSGTALKEASEQLMAIADEARKADRRATATELKERTKEIEAAVKPVAEGLEKVETQVRVLETDRKRTEGQVTQMFESVQTGLGDLRMETGQLVSALKRPSVRGSWGEMQLKNVVRVAGMTERVDFHSQPTLDAAPDGRLRPDMTVHLPSERDIVVDSKVPLDAYLVAIDASDDIEAQAEHLDRHAKQLKHHIDKLASKTYHAQLDTQAEFVVCFLPNEAVYCAALDRDPSLMQHGASKGVLIATPTTLLALLYACAYGWQQASIEESAREIAAAGRELHRRFGTFFSEFSKTGRLLGQTMNAYNSAAASAEARLIPQLMRMESMGTGSEKQIRSPRQLDTPPRLVSTPDPDDAGPGELPPAEAA